MPSPGNPPDDLVVSNNNSVAATVVFADAQSYSGRTVIRPTPYLVNNSTGPSASLILAGQNATITSSGTVEIYNGGTLRFVESAGAAARLNAWPWSASAAATWRCATGELALIFAQTINTLNLSAASNVTLNVGGAGTTLAINNLTRAAGAQVNFSGGNTTNQIVRINNGTPGGLGPWATYGGTDFAMLTGSTVAGVNGATTAETGWSSGDYTFNASQLLTGNRSARTLRNDGTARTIALGGNVQLGRFDGPGRQRDDHVHRHRPVGRRQRRDLRFQRRIGHLRPGQRRRGQLQQR